MWQSLRLVTTADDSSVSRPVCCLDTGAGAGGGNQYSVLTKNVRGVNRPSWLPGPRWALSRMNDRAEECDPPLLAATSAQARPRLQLAEILGPIAGHMIAPAAPCLTVPCQLRR